MKYSFVLVAVTLIITLTTVTQVESRCGGLSSGKRINRCRKTNNGKWKTRSMKKMTLKNITTDQFLEKRKP